MLTAIYGPDYMTPPPEGERNRHNSEIIVPQNAQGEALASRLPLRLRICSNPSRKVAFPMLNFTVGPVRV